MGAINMKRRICILIVSLLIALASVGIAHSGTQDSSQGHKDTQNESGLGAYHYHCQNSPAHLHTGNGVCPYSYPSGMRYASDDGSSAIIFVSPGMNTATMIPAATTEPSTALIFSTPGIDTAATMIPAATTEPSAAIIFSSTTMDTATAEPTAVQPVAQTIVLPKEYASIEIELRYGQTNIENVNLRILPDVAANKVDKLRETGTALVIIDDAVDDGGDAWYVVWYIGRKAYVKAAFVDLITEEAYWAAQ